MFWKFHLISISFSMKSKMVSKLSSFFCLFYYLDLHGVRGNYKGKEVLQIVCLYSWKLLLLDNFG